RGPPAPVAVLAVDVARLRRHRRDRLDVVRAAGLDRVRVRHDVHVPEAVQPRLHLPYQVRASVRVVLSELPLVQLVVLLVTDEVVGRAGVLGRRRQRRTRVDGQYEVRVRVDRPAVEGQVVLARQPWIGHVVQAVEGDTDTEVAPPLLEVLADGL